MVSVQPEAPNEVDAKNSVLTSLQQSGILPTKGMVTEKIAEGLASQVISTLVASGNEPQNCVADSKANDINDMRKRVGLKTDVSDALVGQVAEAAVEKVGGKTNLDNLLKKLGITPLETGVSPGYNFNKFNS